MRGKFITFEGGEGSGKSTQIKLLSNYLKTLGVPNMILREPGGVAISEQIRQVILDTKNQNMDSMVELFLFMASRRQNVIERIIPTLEEGCWVLCDRFHDSTTVYQGICRGLGLSLTDALNKLAIDRAVPDLTLWFDIDPEIGLSRIGTRGDLTRIDAESLEFHKNVREGYNTLYGIEDRIHRVDAGRSIEDVYDVVCGLVNEFLDAKSFK
jgi:dTMP kinase